LAAGWDDEDVAMLKAMAGQGLELSGYLVREAAVHVAAAEVGETAPLTPGEQGQVSLAFSRVTRSVRLSLSLKAHAKGADGPAPSRTVVDVGPPDCGSDIADLDDPQSEAAICAAQIRFGLEHAITDPRHDAAEAERLREGLEAAIEREAERERLNLGLDNFRLRDIAHALGLTGEFRSAEYADGRCAGDWIFGRADDPSEPLTWPDPPPRWSDHLERWKKPAPGALPAMTCHATGEVDSDEAAKPRPPPDSS
jgi:hypothetical protein